MCKTTTVSYDEFKVIALHGLILIYTLIIVLDTLPKEYYKLLVPYGYIIAVCLNINYKRIRNGG